MQVRNIFDNYSMAANGESGWINTLFPEIKGDRDKLRLQNGTIEWKDATGDLDGVLTILSSPDSKTATKVMTIALNEATNIQDVYLILFSYRIRYIKFKYEKNGITSGKINIKLFYE